MRLGRMGCMVRGMHRMRVRQMGMVCSLFMMTSLMLFCRFFVVLGCFGMMFGCVGMMLDSFFRHSKSPGFVDVLIRRLTSAGDSSLNLEI
jgi:hypothetical protein